MIHGHCTPEFEPLKEAFETNFNRSKELGAAVAVTHHGEPVVDLFGGFADRQRTTPWQSDTLVNLFSTTKIPLNVCALMLVDQGKLDLDVPVKQYWPEMKGGAKDKLTTRHIFMHEAGLPGLATPVPFAAKFDWNRMIQLLEQEELWFEPGTAQAYHAQTYGYLLGEVIHRITGEMPGEFFRNYVAGPLKIDLHMGLPESEDARVSQLYFSASREFAEPESIAFRIFNSFEPGSWERREARIAEMPDSNGIGNARSVARLGAMLAMSGELDGVRVLSREILDYATREHSCTFDLALEDTISRGLGFGLESAFFKSMSPDAFFWGGYGGSVCMMDMKREISFAYTPNLLSADPEGDERGHFLTMTIRSILEANDD